MIQLLFSEVRVPADASTPVLLLREAQGTRHLAVWISAAGGNAILSALDTEIDDEPTPHDLMLDVLSVLDAVVQSVRITGVDEGVFSAELSVDEHVVGCRVSDGIALALRCGAPILVTDLVMEQASVALDSEGEPDPEGQVEQFREFLEQINADDFDAEP